jgi:hypothetical protein
MLMGNLFETERHSGKFEFKRNIVYCTIMERTKSLHSVIHLDDNIAVALYCAMLNVYTIVEFEVLVPMKKVIWCKKETKLKIA